MQLTLDIANELYPLTSGETFTLALARSLSPEEELAANGDEEGSEAGGKRVKKEMWRSEDQGLAADYEYVMYGKVSERPWTGPRTRQLWHRSSWLFAVLYQSLLGPGRVRWNSASLVGLGAFGTKLTCQIYKFDDSAKGENQT